MTVSGGRWGDLLSGLDYPVSREDLVRWAQENGASTELLQSLRALPVDRFDDPAELSAALGALR